MTEPSADPSPKRDFGYQPYRAPRGHAERLVQPPVQDAADLIAANRQAAESLPRELQTLRGAAREQLIRDARKYTASYRDVPSIDASRPIVMAGHQPTLFHPGVWFKNMVLDRIGKTIQATAVNLVVDSDVAGPASMRVPHQEADGQIRYVAVPFDARSEGVPLEQTLVEDQTLFGSFATRVTETVSPLIENPSVTELWPHAIAAVSRCGYAGCALAQGRHALEAELGMETLEIPQSVVCRSDSFAAFAMQILNDLPQFRDCYNRAAQAYRLAHGIRSSAHPVPDLGSDGDWFETPFWVYGNQSPHRRGLWARQAAGGRKLELSDRENRHRTIDNPRSESAYEALASLASPEFKLRSRALITTMYARLILSDLFLHGIGGGKYDQLGDRIAGAFWSLTPPKMMVVSGTVLLPGQPVDGPAEVAQRVRDLKRQLRDTRFQGERFADALSGYDEWIDRKRSLLVSVPPKGQRADWHHQVDAVNHTLAKGLLPVREELLQQLSAAEAQGRQAAMWASREHPFCVFPLDYLRDAYERMLR